jgi:hypothetical protein
MLNRSSKAAYKYLVPSTMPAIGQHGVSSVDAIPKKIERIQIVGVFIEVL